MRIITSDALGRISSTFAAMPNSFFEIETFSALDRSFHAAL
jgi:hypothetical protein